MTPSDVLLVVLGSIFVFCLGMIVHLFREGGEA